jgi:hypothetical protein
MPFLFSFLVGFLLNEGRILHKVFENNLKSIKVKIILKELGYLYLALFIFLNFCKGFIPFFLFGGNSLIIELILMGALFMGLLLGSQPVDLEGSELIITLGIAASFNIEIFQLTLALFFSLVILVQNLKFASLFLYISNLLVLFLNNLFIASLGLFFVVNYVINNDAQFSSLLNKINKKFDFHHYKGVKRIYESILYTITKFSKKYFKENY